MMRRRKRQTINLLELTPEQRAPWETAENGNVVVLIPKFHHELLVKWLVPRLKYPHVRVKLDKLGSFVWKQCDGRTTVAEMAARLRTEFQDSAGSAEDRIRTFLLMLEKSDLVNLNAHETEKKQP
ncbi:MAG: PqqD family protein [Ignavibacteriales bacterium]|nr:PqqD family protein [Ignavibacteriales bacterium]